MVSVLVVGFANLGENEFMEDWESEWLDDVVFFVLSVFVLLLLFVDSSSTR